MASSYVANRSSTQETAHFDFWTIFSHTQPRTVFQTTWPCFPVTFPYNVVTNPQLQFLADGALVVPSREIPCFYNNVEVIDKPKQIRKFFLHRVVFDLVAAHQYLSLTDPTLLGWYVHLSPEDIKIIQDEGGFHQFLQRHPALELSSHHVYVKSDFESTRCALPTTTSNKHTTSGATTSRCGEMLPTPQELEMFNNNMSVQTAFNRPIIQDPNHQKAQEVMLITERQTASSSSSAAVFKDPEALASFSVDTELERYRQAGTPWLSSQSANLTLAEGCPLQSEWPTEREESSGYYSCDSIQMDGREYSDGSIIQSVEQEQVSCLLDSAEGSRIKEGCEDPMVYGTGEDKAGLSFEDRSDNFLSIKEDDDSILVCVASENMKAHIDPVTTANEALAASCEALTSAQSVVKNPRVTSCDVMVGTELAPVMSAFTQTEDPGTSDKNINTEVHMSDLDYVTKKFIKLKMAEEKRRETKMKSASCKVRKPCDCMQRAQQAELCLLALQYSMCRQHCWTLYYISAEGGQLTQIQQNPPANIVGVLQKLESDYYQMKDKVLAGVPLQQLEPLAVDSEKVTTGASYIPAQIIGDVLGNVSSRSSQEQQKQNTSGEENGCRDNQSRSEGQRMEKEIKKNGAKRAVTRVLRDRDAIHNLHKQEQKHTKLDWSETWYDAEEDLEPAAPAGAAEMRRDPAVILKEENCESKWEETKSSVLCVSNLPSSVTESDVMLWFEKYHASEVSISALKNDLGIAIVMISGPQSAEAAVRELNGCSMQGHVLQVELISRATGGSQSQASAPESSQDVTKLPSSEPDSSSPGTKLMSEQPLGSSICAFPTAKETSVAQHSGSVSSFSTLMAQLTQQHPHAGWQRIVDALVELKAEHHGVLGGLPLRTIRDMASELLTRPASAEQS